MTKAITYMVKGKWPFPTDMLRHDRSKPATAADRAKVRALSKDHCDSPGELHDVVEVTLTGPNKPNTARWESFQWEVPNDLDHAIWKQIHARDAERRKLREGALAKLTPEEREALGLPKAA